jgi:deoxyribonuclease-4
MGLDCFEYSFGRGVNLTHKKAEIIGEAFSKYGVEISVHAPYFINFAGLDEEKVNNSYRYVLSSCEMAKVMGAKRVVFHPAAQGKLQRDEAVNLTIKRLSILAEKIYESGYDDMYICPETMGKSAQIGTVEEVAQFCTLAPFYVPCIDFGHVNARTNGTLVSDGDFLNVLNVMESIAGREKLDKLHVHFSKIMYSEKGEIKHLTFDDSVYGPDFTPLAKALLLKGLEPYIVSESAGTQDIDAKAMKNVYFSLK